jgi:uncharacterized protein YjdB
LGHIGVISVIGTFPDGSTADLTQSTLTTYRSDATGVATVDEYGRVSAVGPGSTKITITNNDRTVVVPVTVADK